MSKCTLSSGLHWLMLCPHCCYVLTLTEYPESDVQLNIATVTFVTSLAMSTAFHRLGVSAAPLPPLHWVSCKWCNSDNKKGSGISWHLSLTPSVHGDTRGIVTGTGFSDQRSSAVRELWSSSRCLIRWRDTPGAHHWIEFTTFLGHASCFTTFLAPEIFFRVYFAVKPRREGKLQASENLWGSFPIFANDTDTPFRWKVHDLCFENSIWSERSNISREHRVV